MSAASKRASVWASRLPLGMTSFNMTLDGTGYSGPQALVEVRHLDRVEGRLVALVAGGTPRAILRLLVVVGGEHAEDDRNAGVEAHPEDPLLGGGGDEGEVVGLAPDHRPDAHHGVDGPRGGEPARRAGQFEGARHRGDRDGA